jgi:hypothetical protein
MTDLRHIEDSIDRLTAAVVEFDETFAYHAGLAIKVRLLDSPHLNDRERDKLRSLVIAEVVE